MIHLLHHIAFMALLRLLIFCDFLNSFRILMTKAFLCLVLEVSLFLQKNISKFFLDNSIKKNNFCFKTLLYWKTASFFQKSFSRLYNFTIRLLLYFGFTNWQMFCTDSYIRYTKFLFWYICFLLYSKTIRKQ